MHSIIPLEQEFHLQDPLLAAAAWGAEQDVSALLSAKRAEPSNASTVQLALALAAANGHANCVKLLLPFDPRSKHDDFEAVVASFAQGLGWTPQASSPATTPSGAVLTNTKTLAMKAEELGMDLDVMLYSVMDKINFKLVACDPLRVAHSFVKSRPSKP